MSTTRQTNTQGRAHFLIIHHASCLFGRQSKKVLRSPLPVQSGREGSYSFFDEADIIAEILQGDSREVLKTFPDNHFHSIITDPPYELTNGKTTDKKKSGGFMGKAWDATGVAYDVNLWKECLRVLRPGGYLLSFGGSRTYHRMACAIEDAGFEIRDCINWVYGCLSPDTEIMVNGQWEPYHKANIGSLTLCYNNETDSYSWQPIQEVFEYRIKDTAYRIQSDLTDQIVSRNHRCLIEREGKLLFCLAEEAAQVREIYVPILESVRNLRQSLPLPEPLSSCKKSDLLREMQCPNDKFEKNREASRIDRAKNGRELRGLRETNASQREGSCAGQNSGMFPAVQWSSPGGRLEETCTQRTCCVDAGKRSELFQENERVKQSCMEGRCNLLQNSRELSGREICPMPSEILINGPERRLCHGASFDSCPNSQKMPKEVGGCSSYEPRPNRQPNRESSAIQNQSRSQEIRGAGITRTTLARIEPIDYDGIVWCIRVPTGAFVARRNGKIFVTGNSGFPKSLSIDKAFDKDVSAERKIICIDRSAIRVNSEANHKNGQTGNFGLKADGTGLITAPSSPEAIQWAGWGTALKPAHEPIVMARKPLEGRVIDNIRAWGCGGIAIDKCRISTNESTERPNGIGMFHADIKENIGGSTLGRFPSNLILSHSPGCVRIGRKKVNGGGSVSGNEPSKWTKDVFGIPTERKPFQSYADATGHEEIDDWQCVEGCPIKLMGEQSGIKSSCRSTATHEKYGNKFAFGGGISTPENQYSDTGTAARFFLNIDPDPFYYCGKASSSERNFGLESFPERLPGRFAGTSGQEIARRNFHPTVKPLKLMRYLCRLITPPCGLILDPFAGSGTTLCAAKLEGFDATGIELNQEYIEIATARLNAYDSPPTPLTAF